MNSSSSSLVMQALFRTGAIRVSPSDHPFWYTSGMLGPYYVNTHFLYGSEDEAGTLLQAIEQLAASDRTRFTGELLTKLRHQYYTNDIYRSIMDILVQQAESKTFDLISGGERRDFFFSVLLADLLNKPHMTLFKDGSIQYCDKTDLAIGREPDRPDASLSDLSVLHVADLVTEASSYIRAWLPAIRSVGAAIRNTLVVVDRGQGGRGILQEQSVQLSSLVDIDDNLFAAAQAAGILDDAQLHAIRSFHADPIEYMRSFLFQHSSFIERELAAGGQSRERALLCIEKGYAQS